MRKIIALLLIVTMVSVLLVGCSPAEPEGALEEGLNTESEETEDLSDYEPDLIAEDEVDIGEMV